MNPKIFSAKKINGYANKIKSELASIGKYIIFCDKIFSVPINKLTEIKAEAEKNKTTRAEINNSFLFRISTTLNMVPIPIINCINTN